MNPSNWELIEDNDRTNKAGYYLWYNSQEQIYNVTFTIVRPSNNAGGYRSLESLFKLKGI